MKIIRAELFGYERLLPNHVEKLVYTPCNKMQLILGSNGSGKSSLLRELTPLPANSANYRKDGYKHIIVVHNDKTYTLRSEFSPSQRHSFIDPDGIELNTGGTGAVQKELVKQVFGVTQEIHDLLIGSKRFHKMGPAERQMWFTKLSDTDFTYAISVYQKLKEKHRDVLGAIKLGQARSVQESNKLLTAEQEEMLNQDILVLKDYLDFLLSNKPTSTATDVLNELKQVSTSIDANGKRLIGLRLQTPNHETYGGLGDIDDAIVEHSSKVSTITYRLSQIAQQIEEQQKLQELLNRTNMKSVSEISSKIEAINATRVQKVSTIRNHIPFYDYKAAYQAIESIQATAVEIFSRLPINQNQKYGRTAYTGIIEAINRITAELTQHESNNAKQRAARDHLAKLKTEHITKCPNCEHEWIKGYDEANYLNLCRLVEASDAVITNHRASLKDLEARREEQHDYLSLYKSYTDLHRWTALEPLWTHLTRIELPLSSPSATIQLIESVKQDIQIALELEVLDAEIKELNNLVFVAKSDDTASLQNTTNQINLLNQEYADLAEQQRDFKSRVDYLRTFKQRAETIANITATLETDLKKQKDLATKRVSEIARDSINSIIQCVQLELSRKERQKGQINIQKALVENINSQLESLEQDQIVLKSMIGALSPTDGLIAKGLLGFINTFVRQMNSFIRKIWLSPLEIQPCSVNGDNDVELDYKFSVLIKDSPKPLKDVSLGSSAMTEIFDLAFLIVSMKYLGLSDSYIVLDELGHSMDTAHRASTFRAIVNLIAQSNFSQVYIVSHFQGQYGGIANADINIMCPANLEIPAGCTYNTQLQLS